MKVLLILTVLGLITPTRPVYPRGQERLDQQLAFYIENFNLKALQIPQGKRPGLYRLGRELFFEKELSGNRNISCATCHAPANQGVDWLAFAIGEGAQGSVLSRTHHGGKILSRNTPHLFNIDTDQNFQMMFWDGRVRFNKNNHIFFTPLEIFNGRNPKRQDITQVLTSAASMQALFPILSREEMRGKKGENELANLDDPEQVIAALEKRIFQGKKKAIYETLFYQAYPSLPPHLRNIAHLLEAIAHFEKHRFAVTDTPWDRYLRGDKNALSLEEKKGALVFFEDGACIRCHNSDQLGGRELHNIGVPSVWYRYVSG